MDLPFTRHVILHQRTGILYRDYNGSDIRRSLKRKVGICRRITRQRAFRSEHVLTLRQSGYI